MRWRSFTLALMVLVLFVGLGRLYVRKFVRQQAHGIILVVANGMSQDLLQRARQQAAARGQKLFLDEMPYLAQLTVQGTDAPVPDESAAATALASGQRVKNGYVACDQKGQRFDTLLYRAQIMGRRTGLVTTSEVTMPAPASFYGYIRGGEIADQRNAAELIDTAKVDVIFGGGSRHFRPVNVINEMGRRDGRDLEEDAAKYGYAVVHTPVELERVPKWRTRQCLGLFTPGVFHFSALRQGSAAMPTLSEMTQRAIEILQFDLRGYFLVVENGLIAQAARSNLTSLAVAEVEALDEAVRTAVTYAGSESLVIITNGYSLGSLADLPAEAGIGEKKSRTPEWLSGPGGSAMSPADRAWMKDFQSIAEQYPAGKELLKAAPALVFSRQARVTSSPGWLAARGFSAADLSGIYSNTDLYLRLEKLISQ